MMEEFSLDIVTDLSSRYQIVFIYDFSSAANFHPFGEFIAAVEVEL